MRIPPEHWPDANGSADDRAEQLIEEAKELSDKEKQTLIEIFIRAAREVYQSELN